MNETLIAPQVHLLNGIKVKAIGLCSALIVVALLWPYNPDSDLAYKSYWAEIKKSDLDKPALTSHVVVLRYYLRKTHADYLEEELNSQPQITNRQLIEYLGKVATIYEEYQIARHPRRGVLNPS